MGTGICFRTPIFTKLRQNTQMIELVFVISGLEQALPRR